MDSGESGDDRGHTFRKRRLSLTNLRHYDGDETNQSNVQNAESHDGEEAPNNNPANQVDLPASESFEDEKAHSFRKRRLSLTHNREESTHEDEPATQRRRRASDASASSFDSSSNNPKLKSRTVHASELLANPPPTPSVQSVLPRLYQQSAPPQQQNLLEAISGAAPKWKKRHTRHAHEDERNLPFPRDIVGTFSCHGVEPIYDSDFYQEDDDDEDEEWTAIKGLNHGHERPTTAAKINQDRGGVAFPYGNCPKTALFAVYDGHGQGGELVAQFALHEVQRRLEKHDTFATNTEKAFKETFLAVDESLKDECLIEPLYAGTTACVALLRDNKLVLSNAGDSRAVLARKLNGTNWSAIDLTKDQNPDLPEEQSRIEGMGGHVSPPPEPGLSARVWLDAECTQIGLAMARSLGDHAVKQIGVIAEPVVSYHDIVPEDDFVIFATDGVWEFLSSEEAVQIVADNLGRGATKACQALIEAAAARWHDEEGDYRDDITALVVRLQHLWNRSDVKESSKKENA